MGAAMASWIMHALLYCHEVLSIVKSTGGEPPAKDSGPKRPAGKVVFPTGNRLLDKQQAEQQQGGSAAQAQPTAPAPGPNKEDQAQDPPNGFKAFSGKARSLRD